MSFNPLNLFRGSPRIVQLLSEPSTPLQQLLEQQHFPTQFRKASNEQLQAYMAYHHYQKLVDYITIMPSTSCESSYAYKYPFLAAEILAIPSELTFKYCLQKDLKIKEIETVEIEVQRSMSNSSDQDLQKYYHQANTQSNKQNLVRGGKERRNSNQLSQRGQKEKQSTLDDFPQVKKTIIKEYKSMKVINRVEPLIIKILSYFQNPLIHILDGYVCKVLENIINNRFFLFMSYHPSSYIPLFINHIQSDSVKNLLNNILAKCLQLPTEQDCTHFINTLYKLCNEQLNLISQEQSTYNNTLHIAKFFQSHLKGLAQSTQQKLLNLNSTFTLLIPPVFTATKQLIPSLITLQPQIHFLQLIYQPCSSLITCLQSAIKKRRHSFYHSLSQIIKYQLVLHCLLKQIVDPQRCITTLQKHPTVHPISKRLRSKAQSLLTLTQQCFDPLISTSLKYLFECDHPTRLQTKVGMLQTIYLLLKYNVYFSKNTLILTDQFFEFGTLFSTYPNSTILHNTLTKILLHILQDQDTLLFQKLFQQGSMLRFLHSVALEHSEVKEPRLNYLGHITRICCCIAQIGDNEVVEHTKGSAEWKCIKEHLLYEEETLQLKSLAGHTRNVGKCPNTPKIFFKKEDALAYFKDFLTGVAFASLDQFDNFQPSLSDVAEEENEERDFDTPLMQYQDDQKYLED